jgi:PAS domain S-box-containing protein
LLFLRVGEGLAAWLLFNEIFLAARPLGARVAAAFVAYFIANLWLVQRYRAGRCSIPLVGLDIVANVGTLALPIAASGGAASPLLLVFPLKAIAYQIVLGFPVAAAFLCAAGAVTLAHPAGDLLPLVSLVQMPPRAVERSLQLSLLGFTAGAILTVAALRRALAQDVPPAAKPPQQPAHDKEDDSPTAVANALLAVSEAISRLTRLEDILQMVVEVAPRSLAVDYCAIALWAEDSGQYRSAIASGNWSGNGRVSEVRLSPDEVPDFEWVRRLGHCAVVPASESSQASRLEVPALLIAPLLSGDRFYGVMQLARRGDARPFTQRDLTIADGIARQASIALERARLIEESRRLVRALESTGEAILITDAQRRVIFANPAFSKTFGFPTEEIFGRHATDLVGGPEDWIAKLISEAAKGGWRGEVTGYDRNGRAVPILLDTSLMRDEDGRVQGVVAIIKDISAEKALQEQLQRADRLAAVGETAAGIAHEVNNALSAIFGQTARRQHLAERELREAMARVDGQARRIAEIVQGVLGFARPRTPQRIPVDLNNVTRETLALVRHDLERESVSLETRFDPDLPPAFADPKQVQQVLLNLFTNAVQAMAGRQPARLRVSVTGMDGRLAVRVNDTGAGIPNEILPRIFDPFFSTKREGTGLGLSVSYAIARAHEGELTVTSEAGSGTTFSLLLPVATSSQETICNVLLVDDDPEVAESLSHMLANEGLRVMCAANGREALEILSSGAWDAVFLDVRLPDLSGLEVFAELSRLRPEIASRVVFVTGGVWRAESPLRHRLPSQPVLAKPCSQERLHDVLRSLRTQRRQAA